MAAAGGADDELAALRARVVAAGGPAGASKNFATEWLAFADAPVPSFERDGDGKLVFVASETATKKIAYASFFTPTLDAATGRMALQCNLLGCKAVKPISYEVADKDGGTTFPFTNAMNHLLTCLAARSPFLRAGDVKEVKETGGGTGGAVKRARVDEAGQLARPSFASEEEWRMVLLRGFLADAMPLGSGSNFGLSYIFRELNMPLLLCVLAPRG